MDHKPRNQQDFIAMYNKNNKVRFNLKLFEKKDEDLIEAIKDSILSLERNQNFLIQVVSIDVIKNYGLIQRCIKHFISKHKVRSDSLPSYNKIQLEDTEYYMMIVTYYIKLNNPKDESSCILSVPIIVPKIVERHYFKIDGSYYTPIYQINDHSYYNNYLSRKRAEYRNSNATVTFISLFSPVVISRGIEELTEATTGEVVPSLNFKVILFSKALNLFVYCAAKLGLYRALEFHNVRGVYISDKDEELPGYYKFKVTNKKYTAKAPIYVYALKELYDFDKLMQSDVWAICHYISTHSVHFTFEDIFKPDFWILAVGMQFSSISPTIDKSMNIIKSLEGIYDVRSYKKLRLPDREKQTIYHVLLWIVRNFDELSTVNRLDISHKRIRWAEVIASIYSNKITNAVYRLSDRRSKVKLEDIQKALNVESTIFLKRVKSKFKLASYRDLTNDIDMISALKYTLKDAGTTESRRGNMKAKSSSFLPREFSLVHESHLGRLDLDSSPKSDPGLSGILCPLTKVYGPYRAFSDMVEPDIREELYNEIDDIYTRNTGKPVEKKYNLNDFTEFYSLYKNPKLIDENLSGYSLLQEIFIED